MTAHGYTGAQDDQDRADLEALLRRAHRYMDERPDFYPPRPTLAPTGRQV